MPRFKHTRTGQVIDVSEQHADQVIRKKVVFEELPDESPSKPSADYKLKHKGFGKYTVIDPDGNEMFDSPFANKEEAENARAEMQ